MGGCCSSNKGKEKNGELSNGRRSRENESPAANVNGDKNFRSDFPVAVEQQQQALQQINNPAGRGGGGSGHSGILTVFVPRQFSYKEISAATQKFAKDRIIGHGGSGIVYRGDLYADVVEGSARTFSVAVKAITADSARAMKEYMSEITIISGIRHRHLVKLYGWCHEGGLFLLYEYFRHGSLDHYLHGPGNLYRDLPWPRRFEIIKGIGSALHYLHNECDRPIIHRDVKSSNILLDDNFTAKLGDFGLSRQMDYGDTAVQTKMVAGTEGYLAPEVFLTGRITLESEMFSYGALLAEITCGRRPRDEELSLRHRYRFSQLLGWIKDLYNEGRLLDAVDPRLYESGFDEEQVTTVFLVAMACSRENPKSRLTVKEAMDFLQGVKPLDSLIAWNNRRGMATPSRRAAAASSSGLA